MKKNLWLRFFSSAACAAALGVAVCAATSQDGESADAYYRHGAEFALEGRLAEAGRLTSLRFDLREIGAGRMPDPIIQAEDRIQVLR